MPRVESSLFQYDKHIGSLQETQARATEFQKHLSSENHVTHLNDDFSRINVTLSADLLKAEVEVLQKEIQADKQILSEFASNLTETHQLLLDAKQKGIEGVERGKGLDDLKLLANEVIGLQQRLVEIANAKGPHQQFLFAPAEIDTKATSSPYKVVGNTLICNVGVLGPQAEIAANTHKMTEAQVTKAFVEAYQCLESLKNNLLQGNLNGIHVTDLNNLDFSLGTVQAHLKHTLGKLGDLEQIFVNNERRIVELSKEIGHAIKSDLFTTTEKCMQAHNCLLTAFTSIKDALHTNLLLPSFINGQA